MQFRVLSFLALLAALAAASPVPQTQDGGIGAALGGRESGLRVPERVYHSGGRAASGAAGAGAAGAGAFLGAAAGAAGASVSAADAAVGASLRAAGAAAGHAGAIVI